MKLKFFNTLSRSKEVFKPLSKRAVSIYTCGPTVYQYAHIGNMRAYITSDILKRVLVYSGFKVNHIINITDVGHLTSDSDDGEDKIEIEAKKEEKGAQAIAKFYTKAFLNDLKSLNIDQKGVKFPFASKHIKEQVALIAKLEKKGMVYKTNDGIYFDSLKFKNYGKLAQLDLKGLREGARIGIHAKKRSPSDFALWKFSPKNSARQQEWKSPWGVGFPGWHIECSAMSMKYLGERLDIHTGGIDHIPVHHTNEIAQSESATGKKFANYWIHNEFVTMGGEKMAKSTGNIFTITDLITMGITPIAYRYWLLTAHYRHPITFNQDAIQGAQHALERITSILAPAHRRGHVIQDYLKKFIAYVNDDLDTPGAIALMWQLLKDTKVTLEDKRATIFEFDKVLGLGLSKYISGKHFNLPTAVPKFIQKMVSDREDARQRKDWEMADRLRNEIKKLGYDIKDTDGGPVTIGIAEKK